ncbi:C6 transcription factor [Penicillium herquei]|nr:C6 transcription factor [Penicillium herquei]
MYAEQGKESPTSTEKCSQTLDSAADDSEWLTRISDAVDRGRIDSNDVNAYQVGGMGSMVPPQEQVSNMCSQNVEQQSINLTLGTAEYQGNGNIPRAPLVSLEGTHQEIGPQMDAVISAGIPIMPAQSPFMSSNSGPGCIVPKDSTGIPVFVPDTHVHPAAKRNYVAAQFNSGWSSIEQSGQTSQTHSLSAVSLNRERHEEPSGQGRRIAAGLEPVNNPCSKTKLGSTQKRQCVSRRTRGAGCIMCGRRGKTCDGARPSCQNCVQLGLDCGGYKEASQSYRGQRLARLLPKGDNFQFRSYPSNGQTRVTESAANPSSGRLSSVEGRAQASDMNVSACGAQADHLPTQAPTAILTSSQTSPHFKKIPSIKHLLRDIDAGKNV